MSDIVNILHLSDLHYTTSKDEHNQRVVLNALFEDLKRICEGGEKPDFVIFSGDLVKAADEDGIYYDLYENVLKPIQEITRCSDSRIVLCPGNHDAQRSVINKRIHEQNALLKSCDGRDLLNDEYCSGRLESIVNEKFENFHEIQSYFSSPKEDSVECQQFCGQFF